jgi:hypothetical protein
MKCSYSRPPLPHSVVVRGYWEVAMQEFLVTFATGNDELLAAVFVKADPTIRYNTQQEEMSCTQGMLELYASGRFGIMAEVAFVQRVQEIGLVSKFRWNDRKSRWDFTDLLFSREFQALPVA